MARGAAEVREECFGYVKGAEDVGVERSQVFCGAARSDSGLGYGWIVLERREEDAYDVSSTAPTRM